MKYLKMLVLLFFLFSCSSNIRVENKNKNETEKSDTICLGSKTTKLDFDKNDINKEFNLSRHETPFKGSILSKAKWNDHNGRNILIISKQDTNYNEGFGTYELFAYQYTKKENKWELNWQMNDFVKGMGCDLEIEVLQTEIVDIDKDGSAEVILIYTLDNRCDASLLPTKLLLYKDGNKLAIRGYSQQFLLPPLPSTIIIKNPEFKNRDSSSYKRIDTSQFSDSPFIIEYASITWDSFIEVQNKEYWK